LMARHSNNITTGDGIERSSHQQLARPFNTVTSCNII